MSSKPSGLPLPSSPDCSACNRGRDRWLMGVSVLALVVLWDLIRVGRIEGRIGLVGIVSIAVPGAAAWIWGRVAGKVRH